jgi:tagatose-6-phosphate ketose/aldose isomerase
VGKHLMGFPGRDEAELEALGGRWTAREIAQQPAMLRQTHSALAAGADALAHFLRPLLGRPATRVVLTGAGTSAFIGECLAPYLAGKLPCRVEAIPTTDLVCAPRLYLERETSTLLVSFARSGNSPESVAAVELAEALLGDIRHLGITCNRQGALARRLATAGRAMTILLPEETDDRGFAMTSSFSCMTWAGLAALSGIDGMQPRVERIARAVEGVIAAQAARMQELARGTHGRVVYLGSHVFKGLAREAALKLTELTDGALVAVHDSPLGFRHGPKTIVDEATLVAMFLSNDDHARRYELDLVGEIVREARHRTLLVISARDDGVPAAVEQIGVPDMAGAEDVDLLFPYIAAPQMLAFEAAISRRLAPDHPNVAGTVHRVVQGVRIHPFASAPR